LILRFFGILLYLLHMNQIAPSQCLLPPLRLTVRILVAVLGASLAGGSLDVRAQPSGEIGACTDLAGEDFGECDMALGVAVVDGVCTFLSGCGYVVDGVDYSGAFFDDEPTCTMCNEVPPECGLQLVVTTEDGMWYTFTAIDVPDGVTLEWHIDDFLAQTGGEVFEAGFDFNPNWSVCVSYWSDPCGGEVVQCYSNLEGVAPCTDVAGVDFGLCAMPLGVARVNGLCQPLSGCGMYAGGVNYQGAFFESIEECVFACAEECVNDQLLELGWVVDCITLWDPVCGCDGTTYGNSCLATYIGGVTSWASGECPTTVYGCTYEWACNFDPAATVDNGTCTFPPMNCAFSNMGCTYPDGLNYDPNAEVDDGSCTFELVNPCPGDLNWDGFISVADILALLSLFGNPCS